MGKTNLNQLVFVPDIHVLVLLKLNRGQDGKIGKMTITGLMFVMNEFYDPVTMI